MGFLFETEEEKEKKRLKKVKEARKAVAKARNWSDKTKAQEQLRKARTKPWW